jgi:argininosuccinate synthase
LAEQARKVVLAYSGGLDTSIILKWLLEEYKCEVIAFAADLGQGDDLETVRQKALDTGASKVIIEDLREEFVRDYVFPAFRAGPMPSMRDTTFWVPLSLVLSSPKGR